MVFDYKKAYKEYYLPKTTPSIVEIPAMNFIAVRGKGSPNEADGEYSQAIETLYAIAYTLRMSYKGDYKIDGFFEYVVPPLEGFWWMEGIIGIDELHKEKFEWIALLRLPEFISPADFEWARKTAEEKKKKDYSKAYFYALEEGLCVQCMHFGSYDNEIETLNKMHEYIEKMGYVDDTSDLRRHHEIYLSDPRKTAVDKLKTVIRHPIRKK